MGPFSTLLLAGYQLLFICAGLGYLLLRVIRGRGIPGFRQRCGWYSTGIRRTLGLMDEPIWIHLVSVGEAMAAEPLLESFRKRFPGKDCVITTVTPTGQSVAKRLAKGSRDLLLYLPWDLEGPVHRAIQAIRPSLFIVFETELWPVLFHRLRKAQVPIVLVNGRVSPGSYRRYLWVRFLMERVLGCVNCVLTQSPQDARRYAGMGAAKDRILVTGNVKWDLDGTNGGVGAHPGDLRTLLGVGPQQILWTAGSTHRGEETLILRVYERLKREFPSLRLLLAPRHPERIPEVEQEVRRLALESIRRSDFNMGSEKSDSDPVILLDTIGELKAFYEASDVVFVGGSLVPKGGHNLVEPALFSRPILTGPSLSNFEAIAESLLAAGGLAMVQSEKELEERLRLLLGSPVVRRQLGVKAAGVIEQHRGATERTVEAIAAVLRKNH